MWFASILSQCVFLQYFHKAKIFNFNKAQFIIFNGILRVVSSLRMFYLILGTKDFILFFLEVLQVYIIHLRPRSFLN